MFAIQGELTKPERDSRDFLATERGLESIQDVSPVIADDFVQPGTIIHGDKERALVYPGRLGVSGDPGVDGPRPYVDNFGFRLSLIKL